MAGGRIMKQGYGTSALDLMTITNPKGDDFGLLYEAVLNHAIIKIIGASRDESYEYDV
jgi:hypothetical protein